MVDFTSTVYRFHQAVAEGDFHRALGLSQDARKLDVDVAAARMADRMPSITDEITAVANVLVMPELRAVYRAICALRDGVQQTLVDGLGDDLAEEIPNCRRVIWERSCKLRGFDLAMLDSLRLPSSAGADSLTARDAKTMAESILAYYLMEVYCCHEEIVAGSAVREVWYADCPGCGHRLRIACKRVESGKRSDPASRVEGPSPESSFDREQYDYRLPSCPRCRAEGVDPSAFEGIYEFALSLGIPFGSVVHGERRGTGKALHAVLGNSEVEQPNAELGLRLSALNTESPRRPAGARGESKGMSGLGWIVAVVLIVAVRGGCEVAKNASDRQRASGPPYDQPWIAPDIDPMERFLNPPRLGQEPFLSDRRQSADNPLDHTLTLGIDTESRLATEEAARLAEEAGQLGLAGQHAAALSKLNSARDMCQRLIARYPVNTALQRRLAGVLYSLGATHARLGHPAESIGSYEAAIAIYDDLVLSTFRRSDDTHRLGGAHCNLANQLRDGGEYKQALSHYAASIAAIEEHLESTPQCKTAKQYLRNALCGRGRTYSAMENWEEAAEDLARAVDLAPESWKTNYYLALVELRNKDQEGYAAVCRSMLDRFGSDGNPSASNAAVWTAALAPNAVSDYGPLIDTAKQTVAANPGNPAYRSSLGAILYRAGRSAAAVEQLRKAVGLRERDNAPVDWLFLSMAYYHENDPHQAQDWLERTAAWIDKKAGDGSNGNSEGITWSQELEIQLLREEIVARTSQKD